MRSGRRFCGLTNPRSPLQALAIDPGLSDLQKKSIILIASRGRVSGPEALEAAVKAAWDSITEGRLEELIRSMPARLQAVIDADGHPTPY